ncbi:MAG: cytidylate kinase-like family protein [Candidatus Eremiobacteraeota bacterium]|nr:cytidylate kinase-like family protein [Candidatus Eremiobacteraeota bacterium]MBV8204982.1 cytidylate kinase-like family protein [Candidatus Eremiobacteraeota bacterium]MBV8340008.1 cytidylate kinase-like family protein [Candidatus Eremiobacteraeota bacterium]MBV8595340.1 cytidylate kinase-like family protein [Candidatus Eremiobacteraeota bacterium]MBV8669145.1 cytidylate kinase-like family protein [Candidatus Eremiobacteraeota bacterium]
MIVAIGRELGSGGREVGELIAERLGVELLDKQIVDLVAARLGAPASYVEAHDEHVEGFVDRLFRVITSAYPEAYAAEGIPDWSEERLVELTGSIIKEHAATHSLVVIGRGAPLLLRDRRDAVRAFITAPFDVRVQRVQARTGCALDFAAREVKKSDQHRLAYMRQHYNVDWRDPGLYDIVLNTEHLSPEAAAEMIIAAGNRLPVASR